MEKRLGLKELIFYINFEQNNFFMLLSDKLCSSSGLGFVLMFRHVTCIACALFCAYTISLLQNCNALRRYSHLRDTKNTLITPYGVIRAFFDTSKTQSSFDKKIKIIISTNRYDPKFYFGRVGFFLICFNVNF